MSAKQTEELFEPYKDNPVITKLIQKARKTNASNDQADKQNGFASPKDLGMTHQLRTVISALVCALATKDWNCVGEAIDMVQQLELKLRLCGIGDIEALMVFLKLQADIDFQETQNMLDKLQRKINAVSNNFIDLANIKKQSEAK